MTELTDAITEQLQALWGPDVAVSAVRPMPGGASRESWDVRVRLAGDGLAGEAARNAASSCSATRAAGPGPRSGTWPSRRRR